MLELKEIVFTENILYQAMAIIIMFTLPLRKM